MRLLVIADSRDQSLWGKVPGWKGVEEAEVCDGRIELLVKYSTMVMYV